MTLARQWDVVRFRIKPDDRDLHPGIVLSGEEWCATSFTANLNVLACSKRLPTGPVRAHQVVLNGADGVGFQTVVDCRFFHIVAKNGISEVIGRVSPERRRAIGRKINEVLRLAL
jgi:hypothetical protein